MKFNKLFAFVAALAVVGCTNELAEDGIITNNDEVALGNADTELVITAGLADEESKATIQYGRDSKKVSAIFEYQDAIGVYLHHEGLDFSHMNVKFEALRAPYDSDGDGINDKIQFKAMESSMLLQPGVKVYAYYPFENGNTIIEGTTKATQRGGWDGTRQFTFDTDQSIENDSTYSKLDENILMIANPVEITKGENNSYKADMRFRFANSFVTLHIKNNFTRDMTIKSVKVQLKSGDDFLPITGDFSYDFDLAGSLSLENPFTPVDTKDYVIAKFGDGEVDNPIVVPANNAERVCIPMVIAPVEGVTQVVADIYTEDGEKDYFFRVFVNVPNANIARGQNAPIGINLDVDNRYDDDYVHIYDFASLKNYIQNGANPGARVVVDADIDGTGEDAIEVTFRNNCKEITGNAHKSYDCFADHTVDGNFHTLSNIKIVNKGGYAAGFISAGNGTDIKDLTFKNWDVQNGDGAIEGYNGIVMGSIHGETTLENVKVIGGQVKGINKVGGLIGFAAGAESQGAYKQQSVLTVKDCLVQNVDVIAKGDVPSDDYGNAGLLIGFLQSYQATLNNAVVDGGSVAADYEKENRYSGLYIGAVHVGKWSTSGTPEASVDLTIEGSNLIQNDPTFTVPGQFASIYETDNYQGKKALIGGLRDGKYTADDAVAVVKIEGYTFNDTKPAYKEGTYHIFNRFTFINLTENFTKTIAPLDGNIKLMNDITLAAVITPIYRKSNDVSGSNEDVLVFDGNGKILSQGVIDGNSLYECAPGQGGVNEFKNLTVHNLVVGDDSQHDDYYAAIFVAKAEGDLKFENITLNDNHVCGSHKVGLLAGYVEESCNLEANNITLAEANSVRAYQGQTGMLVGYMSKGTIKVAGINGGNVVYSGANDETGAAKVGRTFGKLVGTIGNQPDAADLLTINYPVDDINNIALNAEGAAAQAYANTLAYNTFEYVVGGWDADVTEATTAVINGSKPYHANAFNIWDVETLKLRAGKKNYTNRSAYFDKEIHRNMYLVRDINKGGAQFDFDPMTPGSETFNGQDCGIYNVKFNVTDRGYAGLYGERGTGVENSGVTVKDLTIDGAEIDGANIAGVVIASAANVCNIDNVIVKNANVVAYNKVGGLVGYHNNIGPVLTIKNSKVIDTELHADPELGAIYDDGNTDAGQVGGLIGYVMYKTKQTQGDNASNQMEGAVTVKDCAIENVDLYVYAEAEKKNSGLLIGTYHGAAGTAEGSEVVIENTTIDGTYNAELPWYVNLTESSINAITNANEYTTNFVNNIEYESYGMVLGGWRNAGGSVSINGIEYDRDYKGMYVLHALEADNTTHDTYANGNKAWYASFKQLLAANGTESLNIINYSDKDRYFNEPYTVFGGNNTPVYTIQNQNDVKTTVNGQFCVNKASLTINGSDNWTMTNKGAYAGHLASYSDLNGAAIALTSYGKLVVKGVTFEIENGKSAIAANNYQNGGLDYNTSINGKQYWGVEIDNCTFNSDKAISISRAATLNVKNSVFNNIANYALSVKWGDTVAYFDGNTFNGTAGVAYQLGALNAGKGANQILLGDGTNHDTNVYTGISKYTGVDGATEFNDYIVAIIADHNAMARK